MQRRLANPASARVEHSSRSCRGDHGNACLVAGLAQAAEVTAMNLRDIADALGGEVSGRQVLCPGPGHSPRDRSLSVRFSSNDDFVVYSHAGDDPLKCKDYVRHRLGLREWEPGDGRTRAIPAGRVADWNRTNIERETEDQ